MTTAVRNQACLEQERLSRKGRFGGRGAEAEKRAGWPMTAERLRRLRTLSSGSANPPKKRPAAPEGGFKGAAGEDYAQAASGERRRACGTKKVLTQILHDEQRDAPIRPQICAQAKVRMAKF
jgi:hypothetical protein